MDAPKRTSRRWWQDALIGVAVTIALGLGLEIAARVYWHWQAVSVLDDFAVFRADGRWTIAPRFAKNGVDVNSLGFRGPEVALDKPASTFRIVALGDSVTFGHKLRFTYPALLQEQFASRSGCRDRIEIINAGVPGYQIRHITARLQEEVRPLRPDLVLVLAGWNDLYSDNPASPAKRLDPQSPFNQVLRKSFAAKALTKLAFDMRPARGEASPAARRLYETFTAPVFVTDYERLLATADEMQTRVVMVTLPSLLSAPDWEKAASRVHFPYYTNSVEMLRLMWDKYNGLIRDLAARTHRPLIDLAREFAEMPGSERLFADTNHFNPQGTMILAGVLERHLLAGEHVPCGARARRDRGGMHARMD